MQSRSFPSGGQKMTRLQLSGTPLRVMRRSAVALFAAGLTATSAIGRAQTAGTPERFTALAVNMSNVGRTGAQTVEIVVNRWSTDAERDRLLAVLLERGPEKLLETLQDMPRVGYFRTP